MERGRSRAREVQEALFAAWSVRLWRECGTQEGGEVGGRQKQVAFRRLRCRGRSGAVRGRAEGEVREQKVTRSRRAKRPGGSERGREGGVALQRASGGRRLAGLGWARLAESSRTTCPSRSPGQQTAPAPSGVVCESQDEGVELLCPAILRSSRLEKLFALCSPALELIWEEQL